MDNKMKTTPEWVSTKLKREDIHAKPITFKDEAGRETEGRLEVEKVNEQGQMVIRVCYNPGACSGTVMLTAFRLTQEQTNALKQEGDRLVLNWQ
jgi:hypothetical protein